jgi:hypothetical protein
MSQSRRSTLQFAGEEGFSVVELALSLTLAAMAFAATSSFLLAGRNAMRDEDIFLETTHAARASVDLLLRDLRLGGACLPVTGRFVALDGVDNGTTDEIITRTGLTRGDLSCIRTATLGLTEADSSNVEVENVDGFASGTRVHIRHPNGSGEYFHLASVDPATNTLTIDGAFGVDYPATSGVYAIEERRFAVDTGVDPPQLVMQENDGPVYPFAAGIEELNVQYQLRSNCPECDVVDLPANDAEWALVDQILLTVTARSTRTSQAGEHYTRSHTVRVKPRNLLPR